MFYVHLLNTDSLHLVSDRSTLISAPVKGNGSVRWIWSTPLLKGCIHIILPSGEVRVQGNAEQQKYLLDILKEFTREWTGPVPKAPQAKVQMALGHRKGLSKGKDGKAFRRDWPYTSSYRRSPSRSERNRRGRSKRRRYVQ